MSEESYTGPAVAVLKEAEKNWTELDMHQIHYLCDFAANTPDVHSVHEICANELFCGQVLLTPNDETSSDSDPESSSSTHEDEEEEDDGEEQKEPIRTKESIISRGKKRRQWKRHKGRRKKAREEQKSSFVTTQRSEIYTRFGKDALFMDDALAFFGCIAVPTEPETGIAHLDPMRPAVLHPSHLSKVRGRVNYHGIYEWEWYDKDNNLIPNVRVFGSRIPDLRTSMILWSRVARVAGSYMQHMGPEKFLSAMGGQSLALFRSKARNAVVAEDRMANPPQFMMHSSVADTKDPIAQEAKMNIDIDVPTSTQSCDPKAISINTHMRKGLTEWEARREAEREDNRRRLPQFPELPAGRAFAPNVLQSTAPADVFVAQQNYLQQVCLAWGVPMDLLSCSDPSGKTKLNATSSQSSNSMRLFTHAQQHRKHQLEQWMMAMWYHMHAGSKVKSIVQRRQARRMRARARKERARNKKHAAELKARGESTQELPPDTISFTTGQSLFASASGQKEKDQEEESSALSSSSDEEDIGWLRRVDARVRAGISINLPVNVDPDLVMLLYEKQFIKWEAVPEMLSNTLGLPISKFNSKPPMTEMEMEKEEMETKMELEREKHEMDMEMEKEQAKQKMALDQQTAQVQLKQQQEQGKIKLSIDKQNAQLQLKQKAEQGKQQIAVQKQSAHAKAKITADQAKQKAQLAKQKSKAQASSSKKK